MDMRGLFVRVMPRAKMIRKKPKFMAGFEKYRISAALNRNGDYNKHKTANKALFPQTKTTNLFLDHSLLIV